MNDKVHLLLIDDEKNYLLVLETLLTEAGYAVTALNDPETALAFLEESEVDIVITDMKMPRISGREVLERVKKNWPHIPVLIMTAFGSIESAVEAMRYGAFNYITKPFSNDELLLSIQNAAELARAHRQYQLLRESLEERYGKHQIIGRSRAIRDMLALVDRAGPSRATVLITGESGTGKELVARAIHFSSPRSQEPFVSVNCMALNPGVLESELFGHEKGSFTGAVAMRRGRFEQASGGTLFLDEVGELTPELQVKLLRVLQERRFERVGGSEEIEVDIRIVAATNKDLMPLVQAGTFREDLYYRLNVVHIPIPPLRERREDIPLLVAHFAEKAAKENGIPPKTFSTEALNHLSGYEWPGNIRQLQNVVERCLVLVPGDVITLEDLPAEIRDEEAQFKSAVDLLPVQLDLADTLERIEAALIRRGGWSAWLLPELKGSYEGPPPTMIDFAGRDRRWCQGNMQHIKILLSKHLHPVSRIHFTIGIMSYLSSPIWLCFLLVGLAIALGRVIFPPVYFPEVHTLFPTWPIFDKIGTIALFVLSMFMLIFPKFLGLIIYYINEKKTRGAFKSMLAEIVMSALSAPIMMMFQSKFVLEIFTGHAVGWSTQNRGDRGTSCKEAFQRHIWHTVLGIVTTIVVALYARQLFWWMLPITVGLMFSIPISMLTSRVSAGRWAKRHNYFVIPEELNVPQIMQKAAFYEQELGRTEVSAQGVELLLSDNTMANLHIFMLPVNGPAPEFSREVADKARIKLENWLNHRLELDLSKDEELSLLYNADLLKKAAVALLLG